MSNQQLHKRLSQEQVEVILSSYLAKEITLATALADLGLKRARFFKVLKAYRANSDNFKLGRGGGSHHRISPEAEASVLAELKAEKKLIDNRQTTIRSYNYSAMKDTLLEKHDIKISVPTIINRAKKHGYYLKRKEKQIHDRQVLTHHIGQLIQHDSSYHLWSPYMTKKLYLITSLDDFSRLILFADFFLRETIWAHILALKSTFLQYGCPLKYYSDQHSIFRYVKDRDKNSPWTTYTKFTDDAVTQWRQVLETCQVGVIYALSPQAKGKVERPYRWLQDRIVRIAAREKLTSLEELREVLKNLVNKYNTEWVHSTTKEIPVVRFEQALSQQQCLFKPLKLVKPNQDLKDIFCLRAERVVNAYRKVSLDGVELTVPKGMPRQKVELKLVPDVENNIVEVRFWQHNTWLGSQIVKLDQLKSVQF